MSVQDLLNNPIIPIGENIDDIRLSSSWAIWDVPDNLGSSEGIEDTDCIKLALNNQKYNQDFIFIGLNPATENKDDWKSFHSGEPNSRDYFLRNALWDTEYWGSYLTDLLFDKVGSNSNEILDDYFKMDAEEKKTFLSPYIERIRMIKKQINEHAVIIAIGKYAHELLKLGLNEDEKNSLKKITHYSFYFLNIECYRAVILSQLRKNQDGIHMTCDKTNLLKPLNGEVVKEMIEKFVIEQKTDEDAVKLCFERFKNNDLNSILVRTIVLNNRYSAGLTDRKKKNQLGINIPVDVVTMAEHIQKNVVVIDECVCEKDAIRLINTMKNVGKQYRTPLSFVTKYLSWEFRDKDFDIYIIDGFAKGILYFYNEKDGYRAKFKRTDLDDYAFFCEVYNDFFDHLKMKDLSAKKKDQFIWQYAKYLYESGLDVRI